MLERFSWNRLNCHNIEINNFIAKVIQKKSKAQVDLNRYFLKVNLAKVGASGC